MSQQPRKSREALRKVKSILVLPQTQDLRQLWFLVRMDPHDNAPGCFFLTHGRNYEKFHENREKRTTVMAYSFDKEALQIACKRATRLAGPNYGYHPSHDEPIYELPAAEPADPSRPSLSAPTEDFFNDLTPDRAPFNSTDLLN